MRIGLYRVKFGVTSQQIETLIEEEERKNKARGMEVAGCWGRRRSGCELTLDMALLRVGLGTAEFLAPKRRFMMSG